MTRWLYIARLVPLDVPLNLPNEDGTTWRYTFTRDTFAVELNSNRVIPVCDDHQRHKVIGRVETLKTVAGWWEAEVVLNDDQPELERGQPVSIATQTLEKYGDTPFITEVSVVRRGAVEGAVIRNRRMLLSTEFTEPTHTPAASPPASPATPSPAKVTATTLRRTIPQRHMPNWEVELNRRLDRMEAAGHTDTEAVIVAMQREYATR